MLIILFLVLHFNFLFVPCSRLSWLPVSFLLHVKHTLSYRIVSYHLDPTFSQPVQSASILLTALSVLFCVSCVCCNVSYGKQFSPRRETMRIDDGQRLRDLAVGHWRHQLCGALGHVRVEHNNNKCIGDDTKAAARQSLNCIKNKKSKIWRNTIFNVADGILTPCNVA